MWVPWTTRAGLLTSLSWNLEKEAPAGSGAWPPVWAAARPGLQPRPGRVEAGTAPRPGRSRPLPRPSLHSQAAKALTLSPSPSRIPGSRWGFWKTKAGCLCAYLLLGNSTLWGKGAQRPCYPPGAGPPRLQCEAVSGEGRKYNPFCCKDTAVVTVSNFCATFSQMRAFLHFPSFLLRVTARPGEGRGLFCLCFCTEGSHLTSQTLQLLLPPSFQHRLQNKKM